MRYTHYLHTVAWRGERTERPLQKLCAVYLGRLCRYMDGRSRLESVGPSLPARSTLSATLCFNAVCPYHPDTNRAWCIKALKHYAALIGLAMALVDPRCKGRWRNYCSTCENSGQQILRDPRSRQRQYELYDMGGASY